jgi:hypothetical protein
MQRLDMSVENTRNRVRRLEAMAVAGATLQYGRHDAVSHVFPSGYLFRRRGRAVPDPNIRLGPDGHIDLSQAARLQNRGGIGEIRKWKGKLAAGRSALEA